jgi:AcrR family transcriptional regulator
MSQADRREMIVRAALPLIAESGSAVTTSQIARAAGIGEATIFRAFTDKDELLDACVAEAMRPDHALAELAAIPMDQPLAARLTDAAHALHAHLDRLGTVVGALHASGRTNLRERQAPEGRGTAGPSAGRSASFHATHEALAALFEPERDRLRLPPERLATLFMALLFSRPRLATGEPKWEPSAEEMVEVFIHGALST